MCFSNSSKRGLHPPLIEFYPLSWNFNHCVRCTWEPPKLSIANFCPPRSWHPCVHGDGGIIILADRQTDNNLTTFSHLKSWSGKQTVWVVDEYIQKPNKIAWHPVATCPYFQSHPQIPLRFHPLTPRPHPLTPRSHPLKRNNGLWTTYVSNTGTGAWYCSLYNLASLIPRLQKAGRG